MRTKDLSFNEIVRAINSGYMNYGIFAAVQTVREHYREVTSVTTLKQMLEWVQFALADYPFNRGLHATRRAIQRRIDSFSATATNK